MIVGAGAEERDSGVKVLIFCRHVIQQAFQIWFGEGRWEFERASQAHLFFGLAGGATHEKLVLQPGSVPVTVRLHLKRGVSVKLRVAAVDPFKRKAVLLLPFRAP